MRLSTLLLTASLLALTSACAVGPDYARPDLRTPSAYDSGALPDKTESADGPNGAPQAFVPDHDLPAAWWELFHSDDLNRLVTQAIKGNPDLDAAQASLRAAEETTDAGRGVLFPSVDGKYATTRQQTARASSGGKAPSSLYTLNNASVSVSYGLDLFGLSRREIEELEAQEDFQRFQTEGAYLTLTSNVVTAAIQEASLRGQIDATHKIIDEENKELDLLRQQFDIGAVAKSAILAQEATVAQTKTTLPALEKQLSVTRHQLSALLGQFPSDAPAATFLLSGLKLPDTLPVSLPSKLLEQRPDIRAAESTLQADAESLKAQQAASHAADASLDLSRTQFKAGAISYIALLNAEQVAEQSKITLVQAEARRFADTAALFQSLGGGWWNRTDKEETP